MKSFSTIGLYLILVYRVGYSKGLKDITDDVFGNDKSGLLAAFGDFNSDKFTDVFRLSSDRKVIDVLFGQEGRPFLQKRSVRCKIESSKVITNVMPSDFDGNSKMDILITLSDPDDDNALNEVHILWGNKESVNCTDSIQFKMRGQPLIMDYNGDMIPDLFGTNEENKRYVWIYNQHKSFTAIAFGNDSDIQKVSDPHSCAFTDLNRDMVADLLITGEKSIEYWINDKRTFIPNITLPYPEEIFLHGQITFGDINSDGFLEKILPVCKDASCTLSLIMVWNEKKENWQELFSDFQFGNTTWGFRPLGKGILERATFPITLRMGDFNMDGYPDFLAIVQSKGLSTVISKTILLINVECSNCPLGRTLHANWDMPGLNNFGNVQLAAFYDIFENGKMDIVLGSFIENEWHLNALQNDLIFDSYFIKVLVLSGLCYSDCPDGNVPYGTNQPGSYIQYYTTKTNGKKQKSSAVQLAQSAYFPLQLPYSVLGLGETPNFVDELFVTIPGFSDKKIRSHRWNQIIPNSQMVVIPHPPNNPQKWINKLFVTPSRLVILTLFALVGTCIFICFVIGLLHWKEKREDRREKLQEAHRFHFDAM